MQPNVVRRMPFGRRVELVGHCPDGETPGFMNSMRSSAIKQQDRRTSAEDALLQSSILFLATCETLIKKKDKKNFGNVESAFLKDNTDVYDVTFQTEKSIKIKIEVDTCPPLNFKTEQKLLLQPYSFMTRCFTLPDLFAGKMHALVYRVWKNRVKCRDWYDFEWYVRHNVPLDFTHLAERCNQLNNETITPESFKEKLIERLSSADIKQVKEDVLPFVRNPDELDIWSNDYFVQLAEMIRMD